MEVSEETHLRGPALGESSPRCRSQLPFTHKISDTALKTTVSDSVRETESTFGVFTIIYCVGKWCSSH